MLLIILFAAFYWNDFFVAEVIPMKEKYDEDGNQVYDQIWDHIDAVNLEVWFADPCLNFYIVYCDERDDHDGSQHDDPVAEGEGN